MQKQNDLLTRCIHFISKLPLGVLRRIAIMLAVLLSKIIPTRTAQYAKLNIDIAFPELTESARQNLCKQAIKNEAQSYFEFFHIWGNDYGDNLALVHSVNGEHYLQNALEAKKGLVLLVPHFGTWEVMNTWLSQFTTLTVMYKPIKNQSVDNFVLTARSREHAQLVPTDESGVKQIFRALKQGGTTAILPDHSPDHIAELNAWFDVPLYSSQLSAKMIQKTKASVLMLYAIRNDNAGFDIHIEPISDAIYHCDSLAGTTLIHHSIEQLIRRYPEHYHWSYKRFKASPATKNIYTQNTSEALALVHRIQTQTRATR